MIHFRFLLGILLAASPVAAQPFAVQSTGRSYSSLPEALAAIGDGEDVVVIAPGRYQDCAVQSAGRITYRAEKPSTVLFDGGICEGKAALVLRGRGATVDGLVFQNMRVPDGNGAGIRLERGPLTVVETTFRNSEAGIMGAFEDRTSDVVIENSTFSGLGRCDRGLSCAHSIYLSGNRSVTVRGCLFEAGRGGHYLKSRAPMATVLANKFDDSRGRATNYMIDLSEGATGRIERNIFIQGTNKENHSAIIAVAMESRRNRSAGLTITGNRASFAAPAPWTTNFLSDGSGTPKRISGNIFGAGIQGISTSFP